MALPAVAAIGARLIAGTAARAGAGAAARGAASTATRSVASSTASKTAQIGGRMGARSIMSGVGGGGSQPATPQPATPQMAAPQTPSTGESYKPVYGSYSGNPTTS